MEMVAEMMEEGEGQRARNGGRKKDEKEEERRRKRANYLYADFLCFIVMIKIVFLFSSIV